MKQPICKRQNPRSSSSSSDTTTSMVVVVRSLTLWISFLPLVHSSLSCITDDDCAVALLPGSRCLDGKCSNAFSRGGCLYNLKPDWNKVRVCHSEDPPHFADLGYCRPAENEYMEIRILSQGWESVFFESWILQIILSEVLDVPTTIETGRFDRKIGYYDETSPIDFGVSNDWDALRLSNQLGDCRLADKSKENYQSCGHIIPEVWNGQLETIVRDLDEEGVAEAHTLGVLGQQSWYIPSFTAQRDPTLLTYFGLTGEENRKKLAERFLRPTTWKDYCDLVSADKCTTDDGVAKRAPETESENQRMFVEGVYTGHFRKTKENNCTLNPNCTGHIADYPCTWSSYVQPQTHYMNIALESNGDEPGSNGYSYSQLVEMWAAANATKSDIITQWWTPEALYNTFYDTDTELQKVALKAATQDCLEARIFPNDRCSDDPKKRLGEEVGSCDEVPHVLGKVISTSVSRMINDPSIPDGKRSPAYETLKLFKISSYQIGKLFDMWFDLGKDKWNHDPREATCRWLIDNYDRVMKAVPKKYPRVLRENKTKGGYFYFCVAVGAIATFFSLFAVFMTLRHKKKRSIRHAQIEFLFLLLAGLVMVSLAAIAAAFPTSDYNCVVVIWLANIGYTLELVPLMVKVAAINQLMAAARKMRRIVVSRKTLFSVVVILCCAVIVYLAVWTGIDPPRKDFEYEMTDTVVEETGETIVIVNGYCGSKNSSWRLTTLAANGLLLLCATVLAIETRKAHKDFNESMTLAILIYSHSIFVMLRVLIYFFEDQLGHAGVKYFQSLIYSCDVIATISIYFVPKFMAKEISSFVSVQSGVSHFSHGAHGHTAIGIPRESAHLEDHELHSHHGDASISDSERPPAHTVQKKRTNSGDSPTICSHCGKVANPAASA